MSTTHPQHYCILPLKCLRPSVVEVQYCLPYSDSVNGGEIEGLMVDTQKTVEARTEHQEHQGRVPPDDKWTDIEVHMGRVIVHGSPNHIVPTLELPLHCWNRGVSELADLRTLRQVGQVDMVGEISSRDKTRFSVDAWEKFDI